MKRAAAALSIALAGLSALFLIAQIEGVSLAPLPALAQPLSIFAPQEADIFAAGDMMFDRQVRQITQAEGGDYIFSCIDLLIKPADFAVANLEGPITMNASRSLGSVVGSTDNYFFTFPTTTAELLARHNFRAVGIGNNHILNFGFAGLLSTQEYLGAAGLGYFGGVKGNEGVFETSVNGIKLSFVGYNEFGGASPQTVADTIAAEHKAGRAVIVYAHWGDEYVDASPRLRPVAELFSQSGAAAIIGMHPHVVLGHEYIGDTLVYYSLGNFIFDQYWNDSVDHGLSLMLHISKEGKVTADEHPVVISRDGTTCPAPIL